MSTVMLNGKVNNIVLDSITFISRRTGDEYILKDLDTDNATLVLDVNNGAIADASITLSVKVSENYQPEKQPKVVVEL